MDSYIKLFSITRSTSEEDVLKTCKKMLRNCKSAEKKEELKQMYVECIKNFDIIKQKVTSVPVIPQLKTVEEFKKFNDALNENPELYQQCFMAPQENKNIFSGMKINEEKQKELRNVVGQGKNFSREKFNQVFEDMKGEQPREAMDYDDIGAFSFNNMVDNFQDVASYGNVIAHMGNSKPLYNNAQTRNVGENLNLNRDFDEKYSPREYAGPTSLRSSKVSSKQEFLEKKRQKLLQESQRNKEFIQKNSFLFDKIELNDEEERKRLDLLTR